MNHPPESKLGSQWWSIMRLRLCSKACHFGNNISTVDLWSNSESAEPSDSHPLTLQLPSPHACVNTEPGLSVLVSSATCDIIHSFHFKYL